MRLLLITAAVLIVLAASCRNDRIYYEDPQSSAGPPAELLAAIPFPDGSPPQHAVSAVDQLWVYGRQAYLEGGPTLTVGDTMVLSAGAGQLTWAIYEIYPGDFPIEQIYTSLSDVTVLDHLWIGVANFGRNAWDWKTGFEGSPAFNVVGRNVVSPGGGTYLVVASWDDTSTTVHKVWIENDVETWATYPLNPSGLSGEIHSLAIVDGKPAVLLQDPNGGGNHDLFYYYATEAFPSSVDWMPTVIEIDYVFPYYSLSLIDNDGAPSFTRVNHLQQLWYSFATETPPVGAISWASSFISDVSDPRADLVLVDGNPAVAYRADSTHGGDKIMYARANHPQPIGPDWGYYTVAETVSPTQAYGPPALTAVQGQQFPVVSYWNDSADLLYYVTSNVALPTGPPDVINCIVDSPALGGASWVLLTAYQGQGALVYDSVNSVLPLYAHPANPRPETPAEFDRRHRVSHMSANMPAIAQRQTELGIAFRDYRDSSLKYAWYSSDDPVGDGTLDSGADWRIVTVDERPTVGDISLVYGEFFLPLIGYTVAADGLFYLAHVVPTS